MRALRIGGALLLVTVAVLAALLAIDTRSWRTAVAQGDAVYAVAPGKAVWRPPTLLGGAAGTLLDTDADVAIRRALQLYTLAAATPDRLDTAIELQSLRSQAETALARAAHGRHASQADTLLGILAFESAANGPGSNGAEEAIADFTNAVRADPENAAAKFDLELLLRLAAAHGSRTGTAPAGASGRGGRRGAGGGVPGNGY
jgi:hypothetical protein